MRRVSFLLVLAGFAGALLQCIPAGNSVPSEAGPAASGGTGAPTIRPSIGVMAIPFEDNFERSSSPMPSATVLVPTPLALLGEAGSTADAGRVDGGPGVSALIAPPTASIAVAPPDDLGPNWRQAQTNVWHIENGRLCGKNAHNHGVWLQRVLPVNARIEFDAITDSPDGDLKAEVWGDGQSSATGISYTNATSYLTILGGWHNKYHVLARINEHGADRQEIEIDPKSDDPRERPVVKGQSYHFKVERTDGRTVRWFVDGVDWLKFVDPEPLVGFGHDHFGFNDWEVKLCFDNVKVTPLPNRGPLEQSEIEILVNEIETRVDRLRSLYDQYFMGIERVPPAVPHKDVERRLQVLRREQIRNTGLRYRFQMVLQRYNTYQSYWMRICRQIEDGTYKRDVIRAKRKEVERAARESIPPQSIDITADLDVLEPELDDEAPTGMLPLIEPKPEKRAIELDLDEIDDLDDLLDEKPTKIRTPAPEKLAAKPAPAKPPSLPQRPPTPGPMKPAATDPSRPPTPGPIKPGVSDPSRPPTPGAIRPVGVPPVGGARPMWKKVSAPAAGVSIPIAESKASPPIATKQAPAPAAKPEPPKSPPAAAKPAPQPRAARPEPPKPLGPADLSDARVRQIYAEYVRSKRAQNESTAAITYENMAKSIRDSSEKLRDKHGGKKVDFEVQVKDGKTILKPVVKG